ncbi:DUF2271 domain-containing protein [Aquimarina sp. 2201CG1-2-11]|uniref:DUF2271 domain-containing protein n=1 Tax=Aquimarina discodermiae TaxID=3231043 RepID=UPI003461D02F
MKTTIKIVVAFTFLVFVTAGFIKPAEVNTYKCMIQLTNYTGEGAYVIVSLINAEGAYESTLYVQGQDEEWYHDIPEWWNFYGKTRPNIDAISGETVKGGERTIRILKIPKDKINTGYSIRFETAVEDQEYYKDDVQFELTSETVNSKKEGKGFIRYVRMMPQ